MPSAPPPTVLFVDDDAAIRSTSKRILNFAGLAVETMESGTAALRWLGAGGKPDVIVTDLLMPGIHGLEFVRSVRLLDLDVPIIVMTGNPSLETAISTIAYGVHRYLVKPVPPAELASLVRAAASLHRMAILKRRALEFCETSGWQLGDRAALEPHFDRALEQLWMAFQPVVNIRDRTVFGYEALMRSTEPTLNRADLLLLAAERLGRVHELGRRVRRLVAESAARAPEGALLFVNLHSVDLNDEDLLAPNAALSAHARRIILEITERSALDRVHDVRGSIAALRELGYRIAIDDLGAGYAGLSSFGQLEPDIAKLDMSLIRSIDASQRKQSIVRSMIEVCTAELGTMVVCEGVESEAERDTLVGLGADLLQGYLFGRPERAFECAFASKEGDNRAPARRAFASSPL
jgi:EAL domain-containing protein (putative c-di-GMP-specific phosphodiesterase class I)/ActR/RegA family two-component response regulator